MYICSNNFTQKHNLDKHLNDKKCKSKLLTNLLKQNEQLLIEKEQKQLELKQKEIQEIHIEEIEEIEIEEIQLVFHGIFQGRENEIRITPDKMVSVYDFIKVVGQKDPYSTWNRILNEHGDELGIQAKCQDYQFEKRKRKHL